MRDSYDRIIEQQTTTRCLITYASIVQDMNFTVVEFILSHIIAIINVVIIIFFMVHIYDYRNPMYRQFQIDRHLSL
jgi:hypothetical protein